MTAFGQNKSGFRVTASNEEVKKSHPKASFLKGSRVVFNIKGNDYRLISVVDCGSGIVMIRFFETHQEYDEVDAETV